MRKWKTWKCEGKEISCGEKKSGVPEPVKTGRWKKRKRRKEIEDCLRDQITKSGRRTAAPASMRHYSRWVLTPDWIFGGHVGNATANTIAFVCPTRFPRGWSYTTLSHAPPIPLLLCSSKPSKINVYSTVFMLKFILL